MKHLNKLWVVALAFVSLTNVQAQDENNPWQVSFGANFVDFFPTNDPDNLASGGWFSEYFNAGDHWNAIPAVSYFSVSRYVKDGFSLGLRGSLNRIEKIGDVELPDQAFFENDEVPLYALDATVKYNFLQGTVLDPFIEIGGGYTWLDDLGAGSFNGGVGFNVWFSETIGLTLQSQYKHVFDDDVLKHFQHLAGLSLRFGGNDSDGDGVYDKNDACPEVAGSRALNGCPDTDGDGIEDARDRCPNQAGPEAMNGCPDADGDGVADEDDACPNVVGPAALGGCPDSDGDGVADKDDECPEEIGAIENKGCPWTDKDGDGILDKDDKCPEVPGTVANEGCPEVTVEVQKQLNEYASTILFDTGRATIKAESTSVMVDIIQILNEYPTARFTVEGHTDSVGAEGTNQRLSEARALSVKTFLVDKGVEAFRLSAVGYGESRPIASNSTRAGRAQNRRVEINLVKE